MSPRGNHGSIAPQLTLQFEDNKLLQVLFGEHDKNLVRIEETLGIRISSRGNRVSLSGDERSVDIARSAMDSLYARLKEGMSVDPSEVDAALRLANLELKSTSGTTETGREVTLVTSKRHIKARSPGQVTYIRALQKSEMVFGIGPAGTGKTYLAVANAVAQLLKGKVDRIVLSRPAVEAGERLGFLPGDMRDKIDPYLAPLYDSLHDMMPAEQVVKRIASGEIEVAPLAFMRGRTLAHAIIILDEAQNATRTQMKMFLTRLGEGSRMVITGDPSQVDLPRGAISGLKNAVETLKNISGVQAVKFTEQDIVRHSLVTEVVRAYDADDRRRVTIET